MAHLVPEWSETKPINLSALSGMLCEQLFQAVHVRIGSTGALRSPVYMASILIGRLYPVHFNRTKPVGILRSTQPTGNLGYS